MSGIHRLINTSATWIEHVYSHNLFRQQYLCMEARKTTDIFRGTPFGFLTTIASSSIINLAKHCRPYNVLFSTRIHSQSERCFLPCTQRRSLFQTPSRSGSTRRPPTVSNKCIGTNRPTKWESLLQQQIDARKWQVPTNTRFIEPKFWRCWENLESCRLATRDE